MSGAVAGAPLAGAAPDAAGVAAGVVAGVGEFAGGGAAVEVEPSEFGTWAGWAGGVELLHPAKTRNAEKTKAVATDTGFPPMNTSGKIATSIEEYTEFEGSSACRAVRLFIP
jgi:hypothetical protein